MPVSLLKIIGSNLVEIHGQNEHQQILKTKNHLAILDRYAKIGTEVKTLTQLYKKNIELKQKLKSVSLEPARKKSSARNTSA